VTRPANDYYQDTAELRQVGLSSDMLRSAVSFLYDTLDALDNALLARGSERMAQVVELANLSSMIGNIFRTGVAQASQGVFVSNGPHKHPDLLNQQDPDSGVEIKVALEGNQPKGHLAKPGWHLSCHYVLCSDSGEYTAGTDNRGSVACLWLIRFGWLHEEDFNLSNTPGDSGKTAVVNAKGMVKLPPVYFNPALCPLRMTRRTKKSRRIFEHFGLRYEPRE
jgi:hypothetical protein